MAWPQGATQNRRAEMPLDVQALDRLTDPLPSADWQRQNRHKF